MAEAPTAGEETLGPDDAVDVLEEVLPAQNKSYELGLKFKLPHHEVESIHSVYSKPRSRLLHILIGFTNQTEPRPTWRVIVDALRSPAVDLPTLARRVEAAHCPDALPTKAAIEEGSSSTTAGDDVVESKRPSQLIPAIVMQKSVTEVRREIKIFRRRFNSMKESTIQYLEKFKICVMAVACLLTSIEAIEEHEVFLRDNHKSMYECKQHWELFGWLNFYWSYLAYDLLYQLLEVLTLKEDSFSVVLEEMEEYKKDMEKFRKSTTLEVFCLAEPHRETDPPPDFRKMVVEHNWPNTVMLEDVEIFRRSFQETYNLKKCALMVKSVKRGSFIVTWFVHVSAVAILRKGGAVKLMEQFQITRLEIDGNSVCPQTPVQTHKGAFSPFSASGAASAFTPLKPQKPLRQQSLREEDYAFAEAPPDDYFCPVTMGLLLKPHETSCCGKYLSQEAAARIQEEGGACPMCKTAHWTSYLSKHFQREVKELHVLCRYKDRGCDWQGEMSSFHRHICSCRFEQSPDDDQDESPIEAPPRIDSILLEAVGCLMHQENCRIPRCPCREVKKRFAHIIPQTKVHIQQEAERVTEDIQSGRFDPMDQQQQMRLSLSSKNFSPNIHPHYHMTSRSHIRRTGGEVKLTQRRRAKSMDLTPVTEQLGESCATTRLGSPTGILSPVVTPTLTRSPIIPGSPVSFQVLSLSADNLPALCLDDCPLAHTPIMHRPRAFAGSNISISPPPTGLQRWSSVPTNLQGIDHLCQARDMASRYHSDPTLSTTQTGLPTGHPRMIHSLRRADLRGFSNENYPRYGYPSYGTEGWGERAQHRIGKFHPLYSHLSSPSDPSCCTSRSPSDSSSCLSHASSREAINHQQKSGGIVSQDEERRDSYHQVGPQTSGMPFFRYEPRPKDTSASYRRSFRPSFHFQPTNRFVDSLTLYQSCITQAADGSTITETLC